LNKKIYRLSPATIMFDLRVNNKHNVPLSWDERSLLQLFLNTKAYLMWSRKLCLTLPDNKHQCMRLGSVPNLNSQASSPISDLSLWRSVFYVKTYVKVFFLKR